MKKLISLFLCFTFLTFSGASVFADTKPNETFESLITYYIEKQAETKVYNTENVDITEEFFSVIKPYYDQNDFTSIKFYMNQNVSKLLQINYTDSNPLTRATKSKSISGRQTISLRDDPRLDGWLYMDIRGDFTYDVVDELILTAYNPTLTDYGVVDFPNWYFEYKNISTSSRISANKTTAYFSASLTLYGREIYTTRSLNGDWDFTKSCKGEISGGIWS